LCDSKRGIGAELFEDIRRIRGTWAIAYTMFFTVRPRAEKTRGEIITLTDIKDSLASVFSVIVVVVDHLGDACLLCIRATGIVGELPR
jgi:hypothetical protein